MTYISLEDSIECLQLSARSEHALQFASIKTVGDLLDYPVDEIANIKRLGAKSVAEVVKMVESLKNSTNDKFRLLVLNMVRNSGDSFTPTERDDRVAKDLYKSYGGDSSFWLREVVLAKQEHDSENESAYLFWVYKAPAIRNVVKEGIINGLKEVTECRITDIEAVCPAHLKSTIVLSEIITEMEVEGTIVIDGDVMALSYPSVISFIKSIPDERKKEILIARFNGATLDVISQRYDLTRERVRQIILLTLKKKPYLAEDKYIYLFENYFFSLEDFKLAFNERDTVYYYLENLNTLARRDRKPIIDLLQDEEVPVALRKQAEKAVYKEFVIIDGERIRKKRQELAEFIVRTKCREVTSFSDFCVMYNRLIEGLELADNPAFELEEGTYLNKLSGENYTLWNRGQCFRYYFIPERDYEQLLSAIELSQYQDTELSSLKLFRDNPDIMKEYDIRDEYELHNLLRKIWPKEDTTVVFKKMPTIVVGNPDRDTQVLNLLLQYAPISQDGLAQEYEAAYGAKAATVKGSYFKNFSEYYYEGMYSIKADNLPYHQFVRMKQVLCKDFYLVSEIKELYRKEYPESNVMQINPYTIKTLGFRIYSGYAINAKYSSALEYFEKLLSSNDDFSLDDFSVSLLMPSAFTTVLYDLKSKRKLVEYAPRKYVSLNKLNSLGITEEKISQYCDAVRKFAKGKKYYTVASLREDGFSHRIGTEQYEDWFYSSLLVEDRDQFSYKRIGKTRVLTNGVRDVSFASMLVWIIEQHKRMTYTALNRHLETRYGIFLTKDKLLSIVHETSLYYDPIEKEIYINYRNYRNIEELNTQS